MPAIRRLQKSCASEALSSAQVTRASQAQLQSTAPGITPPFIRPHNASAVPVMQPARSAEVLPEAEIFGLANTLIRTVLASVPGAQVPATCYGAAIRQRLTNLATARRDIVPAVVSPCGVQPVVDIDGSVAGSDRGLIAREVDRRVAATRDRPHAARVGVHGLIKTLHDSFNGLSHGLPLALLESVLIVVYFPSWLDSSIVTTALPAALARVGRRLFLTHTAARVPPLTGPTLRMGGATASRSRSRAGPCWRVTPPRRPP
jgi:multidrug efflux pump subunit AcrB